MRNVGDGYCHTYHNHHNDYYIEQLPKVDTWVAGRDVASTSSIDENECIPRMQYESYYLYMNDTCAIAIAIDMHHYGMIYFLRRNDVIL